MNVSHTLFDWLNLLALGALLGAAGQVIRQIAGFKKLLDENPGESFGGLLDATRIVVTLLIGAVAGILAVFVVDMPPLDKPIQAQILVGLMTAGYAGADFVESFMKRHAPSNEKAQ